MLIVACSEWKELWLIDSIEVWRRRGEVLLRASESFMWCLFFFFQAEDGIRDYKVTGVQTCALPICRLHRRGRARQGARAPRLHAFDPGLSRRDARRDARGRAAAERPRRRRAQASQQIGRASCRERV